MNVFELANALRSMPDQQLVQLAQMHQNDAAIMAAVMNEKANRDKLRASASAAPAPQGQQPTVREQMLAGLDNIPTEGMTSMADGGIVSFDDGGYLRRAGEAVVDWLSGTAQASDKDVRRRPGDTPHSLEELDILQRLPRTDRWSVDMALRRKKANKSVSGDDVLLRKFSDAAKAVPASAEDETDRIRHSALANSGADDFGGASLASAQLTGIPAAYRQAAILARAQELKNVQDPQIRQFSDAELSELAEFLKTNKSPFGTGRERYSSIDLAAIKALEFNASKDELAAATKLANRVNPKSAEYKQGLYTSGMPNDSGAKMIVNPLNPPNFALRRVLREQNKWNMDLENKFHEAIANARKVGTPMRLAAPDATVTATEDLPPPAASNSIALPSVDSGQLGAAKSAADKTDQDAEPPPPPASDDTLDKRIAALRRAVEGRQKTEQEGLTAYQKQMREGWLPKEDGSELHKRREEALTKEEEADRRAGNLAWADALISMGAAMMSSKSPTFFGGLGEGVKAGAEEYAKVRDRLAARETRRQDLMMRIDEARTQVKHANAQEKRAFERQAAQEQFNLTRDQARDLAKITGMPEELAIEKIRDEQKREAEWKYKKQELDLLSDRAEKVARIQAASRAPTAVEQLHGLVNKRIATQALLTAVNKQIADLGYAGDPKRRAELEAKRARYTQELESIAQILNTGAPATGTAGFSSAGTSPAP